MAEPISLTAIGGTAVMAVAGYGAVEAGKAIEARTNMFGMISGNPSSVVVQSITNMTNRNARCGPGEHYSGTKNPPPSTVEAGQAKAFSNQNIPGSWYGNAGVYYISVGGQEFTVLYSGSNGASSNECGAKAGHHSYDGMCGGKSGHDAKAGGFSVNVSITQDQRANMAVVISK